MELNIRILLFTNEKSFYDELTSSPMHVLALGVSHFIPHLCFYPNVSHRCLGICEFLINLFFDFSKPIDVHKSSLDDVTSNMLELYN